MAEFKKSGIEFTGLSEDLKKQYLKNIRSRKSKANSAMMSKPRDKAVITEVKKLPNGGIDFNRINRLSNIHKESTGVRMQFDNAMIERIRRNGFDGLEFHIQSIIPIRNLFLFLSMDLFGEKAQIYNSRFNGSIWIGRTDTEENVVCAFLAEAPKIFYDLMIPAMDEAGFNYKRYLK